MVLAILTAGDASADWVALAPSAQLDRILKLGSGFPPFSANLFKTCRTNDVYYATFYVDTWCNECVEVGPGWKASYRFYPDPTREACTLQQSELTVSDGELRDSIRAQLSTVWARKPEPAPSFEEEVFGYARATGTPQRWQLEGSRAWLYEEPRISSAGVVFLWRQDRLSDMSTARPDQPVSSTGGDSFLLRDLCQQAGGEKCDSFRGEVFSSDDRSPAVETAFRSSLTRLASSKPDDPSYPAQLYWTEKLGDAVADRAVVEDGNGNGDISEEARERALALNREFPGLVSLNASFTTNDAWKGESVVFESDFKDRLVKDHLGNRWGRQAFLESLSGGRLRYECRTGFEPAQNVVSRAETFLARYPDSDISQRVRVSLATAYETWWSQAMGAGDSGELYGVEVDRAAAENARLKALSIYRGLLRKAETDAWMEEKIFRLEHGIDTHQRAYGCSDC